MDVLLAKYKTIKRPSHTDGDGGTKGESESKRQKGVQGTVVQAGRSSSSTGTTQLLGKRVVSIVCQGYEGFANSVTHYYHFLFGVVIPLLEFHLANKGIVGYNIKTDVGPMKQVLCELPLNILEMAGPESTLTRADATSAHVMLPAYDIFVQDIYGDQSIPTLRQDTIAKISQFLFSSMPPYIKCLPVYDIVLIERTNNESYYRSLETEKRHIQSGSMLRSIGNHVMLSRALESEFGCQFCNLSLERSSIYYQYHIFSRAKILIAQHGAALSNIVFMKPGPHTAVVEIRPPTPNIPLQFQGASRTHFINLAKHIGLRHIEIRQEHDHADVDIVEVLSQVKSLVAAL